MKARQVQGSLVPPSVDGKWYVGLIRGKPLKPLYLHSDLVMRSTTSHNGEWTGYFDTEAEANAAIEAYQKKEQQ
jgi:hypothetical protein